jgi:hypothetical protein
MSHDYSLNIVTGCGMKDQTHFRTEAGNYSIGCLIQNSSGNHTASCLTCKGAHSPEVSQPGP